MELYIFRQVQLQRAIGELRALEACADNYEEVEALIEKTIEELKSLIG